MQVYDTTGRFLNEEGGNIQFWSDKRNKRYKKCYTKNKIDISLGFTHNSWIFASLKLR